MRQRDPKILAMLAEAKAGKPKRKPNRKRRTLSQIRDEMARVPLQPWLKDKDKDKDKDKAEL